jgi:proteic killer suppression protein
MIKSFRDKNTAAVFDGRKPRRFQGFIEAAERKLQLLDSASSLGVLAETPGNRFEALAGNRKGQFSIRINQQWRICFIWKDGHAYNVEIVDYH